MPSSRTKRSTWALLHDSQRPWNGEVQRETACTKRSTQSRIFAALGRDHENEWLQTSARSPTTRSWAKPHWTWNCWKLRPAGARVAPEAAEAAGTLARG